MVEFLYSKSAMSIYFHAGQTQFLRNLAKNIKRSSDPLGDLGTGLELPPLTALLLSRAASRSQIPQTLVDMREEYRRDRDELWALLTEMWTAHDLAKQRKLLAKLTGLGRSIFQTAFGRKFDALSIGFELAKLSPAGIAGAADKFRQQKGSRIHVHAVSFAEKLSMDLTNFTMANHAILARHLTKAERVQFGAH
jgi:hypothetical protein